MSKSPNSESHNEINPQPLRETTNRSRPDVLARSEAILRAERERIEFEERTIIPPKQFIPQNRTVCPDLEEVPEDHPAWKAWIKSYHDFFDLTNDRSHQNSIHGSPYIAPSPRKTPLVFFAVFLGVDDLDDNYDYWLQPRIQSYLDANFEMKLELRIYQMTIGPHAGITSPRTPHLHTIRDVPHMGDSIGSDVTNSVGSICAFVRIRKNGVLSNEQYALTCFHVVAGLNRATPFLAGPTANWAVDGVIESPAHMDRAVRQEYFAETAEILQAQALEIASMKEKYADPLERESLEYLAGPDFEETQRQEYEYILRMVNDAQSQENLQREITEARRKAKLASSSNITLGTVTWSSGLVEAAPLRSDTYSEKCLMDYALVEVRQNRLGVNRLGAKEYMWDGVANRHVFARSDGSVERIGLLRQSVPYAAERDLPEEDPAPLIDVVKFGRTTNVTFGQTKMRRVVYKRANGRTWADYAILNSGRTRFSDRGDSGSPVLGRRGFAGMLTGGCDDLDPERDVSFFLPFQMIEKDFKERVGYEIVWDHPQLDRRGDL